MRLFTVRQLHNTIYFHRKLFNLVSGTLTEKIVTLNKLPKAATKDFIGVLFPFATDIEIVENNNPDERKAIVICKTPVTSLLVYMSYKRLEINDVHIKITVHESVKAISLPPIFFTPPPDRNNIFPADSIESLNQSCLPRRPVMTPLNRRVLQIKRRALMTRPRLTYGQILRNQRPHQGMIDPIDQGTRGPVFIRPFPRRNEINHFVTSMGYQGPGSRDYMGGPDRRRMMDNKQINRQDADPIDMNVTREMRQLQDQLSQAIKNQIAMINTAHTDRRPTRQNLSAPAPSHRSFLLGQGPRHFNVDNTGRGIDQRNNSNFGAGSWSGHHSGRVERGNRNERDRPDYDRQENTSRVAVDRTEHTNRSDRAKRIDLNARPERPEANGRDRIDRNSSGGDAAHHYLRGYRQTQTFGSNVSGDVSRSKGDRTSLNTTHGSERTSTHGRGQDYAVTGRLSQRNDGSYSSSSHGQVSNSNRFSDYNQVESDSYIRRY